MRTPGVALNDEVVGNAQKKRIPGIANRLLNVYEFRTQIFRLSIIARTLFGN